MIGPVQRPPRPAEAERGRAMPGWSSSTPRPESRSVLTGIASPLRLQIFFFFLFLCITPTPCPLPRLHTFSCSFFPAVEPPETGKFLLCFLARTLSTGGASPVDSPGQKRLSQQKNRLSTSAFHPLGSPTAERARAFSVFPLTVPTVRARSGPGGKIVTFPFSFFPFSPQALLSL